MEKVDLVDLHVRPPLSEKQLRNSPFDRWHYSASQSVPEFRATCGFILDGKGEVGAIYCFQDRSLTISSSMEAEFDRLNNELIESNYRIRTVIGPENIADAIAQSIAEREARVRILDRPRELMYWRGPTGQVGVPRPGFRLASVNDIPVIEAMYKACFPEDEDLFPIDHFLPERIQSRNACVWDENGPKAFALLAYTDMKTIEIAVVMTDPAHQGRGFATNMIGQLIDAYKRSWPYVLPTLLVNDSTPHARKMYAGLGFEGVGRWRVIVLNGFAPPPFRV